jgi:hypothetical protein
MDTVNCERETGFHTRTSAAARRVLVRQVQHYADDRFGGTLRILRPQTRNLVRARLSVSSAVQCSATVRVHYLRTIHVCRLNRETRASRIQLVPLFSGQTARDAPTVTCAE